MVVTGNSNLRRFFAQCNNKFMQSSFLFVIQISSVTALLHNLNRLLSKLALLEKIDDFLADLKVVFEDNVGNTWLRRLLVEMVKSTILASKAKF